jgi:hypothetical protein
MALVDTSFWDIKGRSKLVEDEAPEEHPEYSKFQNKLLRNTLSNSY